MKRMVISCFPDGHVEHTLKDSFLNPFPSMHRKIDRMTDILFDEEKQEFYIVWLKGPNKGKKVNQWNKFLYFDTYDEAVIAEIEIVNAYRLEGASFFN